MGWGEAEDMSTRRELERRLKALEPPGEASKFDCLLVRDVIAAIDSDEDEIGNMLGEKHSRDVKKAIEDKDEVFFLPWLSKDRSQPGGKWRAR